MEQTETNQGKVDPSPQFLAEEKFTFQRKISTAILEHDIFAPLVVNLDQIPLSYASLGKYTFSFKGAKNVPIKGVDHCNFRCFLNWKIHAHSIDLQGENQVLPTKV